jgi:hypothetical protein
MLNIMEILPMINVRLKMWPNYYPINELLEEPDVGF